MNLFFISLLIIFAGGLFAPLLRRHFTMMRCLTVSCMATGSAMGLVDAGAKLIHSGEYSVSFSYLKFLSISFTIDNLSAFFLIIIFAVSLMASVYSFHYMDRAEKALGSSVNYLFFSLLVVSMSLVVTASGMVPFMLSWEMMSISSFFLVIFNYKSSENRRAGYLYFVFSHVGAMFLLSAFGVVFAFTGDIGFGQMATLSDNLKLIVFILFFIGFGSKAGLFPFHVWLPHAHPAAPSHISAVMSGVMIKTGIYGIIRIYSLLHFASPVIGNMVIVAGMVSGIMGVIYALGQNDLKRLLAYSSVENIGIILIGLGIGMVGVSSGNPAMALLGFSGALLHVMNHAIFKSLLFMGAGMVLHRTGSRSIDALGGLLKNMRITGTTFLIGSIAISGLPPFNGFIGEFFIYMGGFKGVEMGHMTFAMGRFDMSTVAIVSLAVIGGLSLACFTKVMGVVFQGEPRTRAAQNVKEKGVTMLFPMMVFATLSLCIGVLPAAPVKMAMKAVSSMNLTHIATESAANLAATANIPDIATTISTMVKMAGTISGAAMIFISVILALLMLRTIAYRNKPITSSGTWGCGFTKPTVKMQYTGTSYAASIVEFFRPFAPLHEDHAPVKGRMAAKSHYQSNINDIAELYMDSVIVKPLVALFDKLHWIQHGDIHLYIGYILLAIVVVMFFV